MKWNSLTVIVPILLLSNPISAQETTTKPKRFNLHFQATYIYQYSARFHSAYEGKNSLSDDEEKQNSLTTTMYGGARLWKGAEIYLNPEVAGGSGLSGALGMGGSSNGETFRVGDPSPTLYLARLYFSQVFALSNTGERQDDEVNQLNTSKPHDYVKFTVGKFCLADIFDNNEFSNSPRKQFMNWSLMNNGSWDFAANVRGYTYIAAGELTYHHNTFKIAAAALPTTANGAGLETNLSKSLSINAEFARNYKWRGKEGNVRLLGYMNRTHLGNYKQAINRPHRDLSATQIDGRKKIGFALNADQDFGSGLGLFARAGWNDGKNETWCFTEIDQSLSVGGLLKGNRWKRADDELGLAFVVNGLSKDHHEYLKAGGYGFILGDGTISYAPEEIIELYYSWKVLKHGLWITGDYQFCAHPGFNKDRGPASIVSLRIHAEL